jgi:hypothetical protein
LIATVNDDTRWKTSCKFQLNAGLGT